MKQYKVKTKYIFECEIIVNADNKFKAKQIVERHFGCVNPDYHTSHESNSEDNEGVCDWAGNVHPTKKVLTIKTN